MILLRLALRNIWLHKVKTILVGTILFMGTALVIVGNSLLDAIDRGMQVSIINSVSGHLQLYSTKAKDEFKLFGNFDGSMPDIDRIDSFARVAKIIERVPNVKTVVPMGLDYAVTTTGSILERKLAELRVAVKAGDTHRTDVLKKHVRRIVRVLSDDLKIAMALVDRERWQKENGDQVQTLEKAQSDAFWQHFQEDPFDALEFLENEVGPLAFAEDMIWVRYIGTDTELFRQTFDRFEIVDGTMIPAGKRGFLFNKEIYEIMIKNKTARRLDLIKEKLDQGQTLAECKDCQTWIRYNVSQAASLITQLDDDSSGKVGDVLREQLRSTGKKLIPLMQDFLKVDDGNFRARYDVFYKKIAPHLVLYSVGIGDEFILTAFARGGGYVRKIPVKVYGTFRFRSLDKSPLAGGFNVMDIMSFRDLYGYMTAEKMKEQATIRRGAGVKDANKKDVEQMFGEEGALVDESKPEAFDPRKEVNLKGGGQRFTKEVHNRTYSREELWNGVVINAAVMLRDGSKLAQTQAEIQRVIAKEKLALNVIDWRTASGIVGQMIAVIRLVLFGAVFIIFVVAVIIVNNTMLMSTLERTREIGTMRAIGAQRGFIRRMFLAESGTLALLFGGIGAVAGSILMQLLHSWGIPATSDFAHFLFAGPRLHPNLEWVHVIIAMAVIAAVAVAATIYPVRVATRITPREAMAAEE
jgi:ABC-type antimicrobial peptide transport system permease subunit